MSETKIEMKVEEEIKPLKELCEKVVKMVCAEVEKGAENIETHELYEVADIIKDLSEAKKNTVEACYKKYILGAMEKAEEEGDFEDDEEPRFYRGQPRNSMGRFTSRGGRRGYQNYPMMPENMGMEVYNPNDSIKDMQDRYYDGGRNGSMSNNSSRSNGSMNSSMGNRSGGSGRMYFDGEQDMSKVEKARQAYMDAMEMHKGNTPEEKQTRVRELDKFLTAFSEEMLQMSTPMSPEEKTVAKTKLTNMIGKI